METIKLTAQAVEHGCGGVLMLPPFYYKDVGEEGLYRYFSEVVQRVGDARLKIYLYHIPPVAVVGITTRLVERLLAAYPNAIAGMKESSAIGTTPYFSRRICQIWVRRIRRERILPPRRHAERRRRHHFRDRQRHSSHHSQALQGMEHRG